MFRELDTVVFDWGGVLVGLRRDRCAEAFARLGYPDAGALLDAYAPGDLFYRLETGQAGRDELCAHIRQKVARAVSDEAVCEALCAFIDPIPATKLRAIRALREAGVATYALSNTNEIVTPHIVEVFLRAEGLTADDYFDGMFLSHELHLLKPDRAIFRRLLDRTGADPARTLLIDDRQENVEAARELGFQVYMPAPDEDFTPLLDQIARDKSNRP